MRRLIFGCGYLGIRAARLWQAAGDEVVAVTRSTARAKEFAAAGFRPILADVTDPSSLAELPQVDSVLYAIGFDRAAGHSMRRVYVEGLAAAIDRVQLAEGGRFVYVSSSGVYGQEDGSEIDEDSPTEPQREAGRVCLDAERLLMSSRLGNQSVILRMVGLYGPGRIPRRDDLLAGREIEADPDSFLNLIHIDDAARIAALAADEGRTPRLYLVSDGHPVLRRHYFAELARLLGAPEPRFSIPPSDVLRQRRGGGDKRVSNRRLLSELPLTLHFSSYREGLAAIVASTA